MSGTITRRGKKSWRIKYDIGPDPVTGARRIRYQTVKGAKDDAKKALTAALYSRDRETHVDPSKVTLETYMRAWLAAPTGLSPKTAERYRELAEQQVYPHLGAIPLQKLGPGQIEDWHAVLLAKGGKNGKPLSARTVGHAHRVLHAALTRAVRGQKVFRNVASIVRPPSPEDKEMQILTAAQIGDVLDQLRGHDLHPIAVLALASGLRRGELLAVEWRNVDLDGGSLRVEHSLEETREGLRVKAPKSRNGRRTVSIPPSAVDVLREHRKRQLELRLALGLGRLPDDALVFCRPDGSPLSPDNLSRDWRRLVIARRLPKVSFHALRHSHVSALISGGLDVFTVSRRIGHGSAALTLRTYTHLFAGKDAQAVDAIEKALNG